MKNLQKLLIINLLVCSLLLAGCGFTSDKPVANSEIYTSDSLKVCTVDVNKLGEIFTTNQSDQIRCLQDNLLQFSHFVRTNNADSISEKDLGAFIRKFFDKQSESMIKGLSIIFQFNMLLLKDEADRISKHNISHLFDLFVKINQEAIIITELLKTMDDENNQSQFWELRKKFNAAITRFSDYTVQIIQSSPGIQKKLKIKDFLIDASNKLGNTAVDVETIDSLIFFKRLLAGGDKEVISTNELATILSKLPKFLTHCFDVYFVNKSNFSNDADYQRFYVKSLIDISSIMEFNQKDFDLFSIDQLLALLQKRFHDIEVKNFKPSILALKIRIIGGDQNVISLKDLKVLLEIGQDYLEKNYFNIVTYEYYQQPLEQNIPIISLERLDLPKQYDIFNSDRIDELHGAFQDIAINLRYFRSSDDGVPFYGNAFVRNKTGFLETSLLNWASLKLLTAYGHLNKDGIAQVNFEQFQKFLFDMKPILEEFKLWPPTLQTFAKTAILMADLFQNKSNGDGEVNITEATEYIQMILTATQITKQFRKDLGLACDGGNNKEDPAFATTCFNEHFFQIIMNRYKNYFPRLANYLDPLKTPQNEINDYLSGVEGFARDNPDPSLPIQMRDNILIIGSMINIETMLIRFDTNQNNIVDYDELVESFKVYGPAIISLAKLKPNQEVYALSIFLYMVSKMEIPPTNSWMQNAKFFAFHKCVSNKTCRNNFMEKIEAKRLNIGKLLYYIVNQK
jgi:hypothetical protein